jgi:hypothetical protein
MQRPGSASWTFAALRRTCDRPHRTLSPWKVTSTRETSLWEMSSSKTTLARLSQSMRNNASLFSTSTWSCRKSCQTLLSWTTSWRAFLCGYQTWMFTGHSMSRWTTDSGSVQQLWISCISSWISFAIPCCHVGTFCTTFGWIKNKANGYLDNSEADRRPTTTNAEQEETTHCRT